MRHSLATADCHFPGGMESIFSNIVFLDLRRAPGGFTDCMSSSWDGAG